MSMELFASKRKALAECYDQVMAVADGLGDKQVRSALGQVKSELFDDAFQLVVVGEFSRGKSTFVNALLGERILPAKSTPTTAIIGKIVYGTEKAFTLHYRDNDRVKHLTVDEFKQLIVKDGVNYGEIAYAEISYPLEICKNGIMVIDTPGTNDVDEMREQISYHFIPNADAAIFVFSATQLCSQSELNFLRNRIMKNDITKIFFAVNHKDMLETSEAQQRVLERARETLGKVVPNPRVFLVSSKQALDFRRASRGETVKSKVKPARDLAETGFVEFEEELEQYLINERMDTKLRKYVSRLNHQCSLVTKQIAAQENSIGMSTAELERRVEASRADFQRIKRQCQKILSKAKVDMESLADELASTFRYQLHNNCQRLLSTIDDYDDDLDAKSLARYLEAKVAPMQTGTQSYMRGQVHSKFTGLFNSVCEKIGQVVNNNSGQRSLALLDSPGLVAIDFDLDDISVSSNTGMTDLLLVGGFILAVNAPLVALGALIFGGDTIKDFFNNNPRNDFIRQAKAQVSERFEGKIPAQTAKFRSSLNSQATRCVSAIEETIRLSCDTLDNQMQRLLAERKSSQQEDKAKRQRLQTLKDTIAQAQQRASTLI